MKDLEKYYGVKYSRKCSVAQILGRSTRSKAIQTAERLLREVNGLFVKGLYSQCLGLLERVVQLVPNDPRPFYLLGLIHEERNNFEKAQTSFYICALLKKSDSAMWHRVLKMSVATDDCKCQAIALGKIYRREPSEALVLKRIECFQKMRKKYWLIACNIELFSYRGVDDSIFEQFKNAHHANSIKIICRRLVDCIEKNASAQTEYFVRNTLYNLYKIKEWCKILELLDKFYFGSVEEVIPEIWAIYYIAYTSYQTTALSSQQPPIDKDTRAALSVPQEEIYGQDAAISNTSEFDDIAEDLIKWGLEESESKSVECEEITSQQIPQEEAKMPCLDDCGFVEAVFLSDSRKWEEIENYSYFLGLADHLKDRGLVELGIRTLEMMYVHKPSIKLKIKLADFYQLFGDVPAAISHCKDALKSDPTNLQAKARLYKWYLSQGEYNLALEYKTSVRVFKHIKGTKNRSKKKYRYSSVQCHQMRETYKIAVGALSAGPGNDDLRCTNKLLEDFFANPFITGKYKNFKSFLSRHEPFVKESGIVLCGENGSRRKLGEKLIRISSLHGLDVEEWHHVVKTHAMRLIKAKEYIAAISFIKSTLTVHIFRDQNRILPLVFLGVNAALHAEDLDSIVDMLKHIVMSFGYSVSFFLYFLCNFFPEFYRSEAFNSFQKNIQRVGRRAIDSHAVGSKPSGTELLLPESRITPYLIANSYIPRYLFTETVDELGELKGKEREEVAIIIGALYIAHSRSRVVDDKMQYAKFGVQLLNNIPGDSPVKNYNLAKAYHFFGYYAQAESLYLKVIEACTGELRNMCVFNLSLIFQRNKSKDVLKYILEKYQND